MRIYETGIILDPQLEESNFDKEIEQVEKIIKANGGKVLEVNRWGTRRLAYEIDNRQQGFYVFVIFEGEGNVPQKLEQAYILNESIMRFMTVLAEWYVPQAESAAAGSERRESRDSDDRYRAVGD